MINVPGYSSLQIIHQSKRTLVYSATRSRDGEKVILRQLRPEFTSADTVNQFRHEFDLLRKIDSDYVVRPLDLLEYNGCPILVMKNTGAQSLASLIGAVSLPITILIGHKIAIALDEIHAKQIVHKDLNPANIIYNKETGELTIIDFGIASMVSRVSTDPGNTVLTGTLAYLAPEQSGRLNRSVDYRADFYSLGVTLYELLTGQRPFTAKDDLELIYSHIAKDPTPPEEIQPEIPRALSRIVMKLLSKMPEDRYQSAYAIAQDLKRCEQLIREHPKDIHNIDFEVALDDIAEQLNISERLMAREQPLKQLYDTFTRVADGATEVVICLGDAGVGKTTLIRELEKEAIARGALVATGRHNPINTEIPYAAVSAALGDLVKQLLTRSDFEELKLKISKSLVGYERSVLRVIPELALVLDSVSDTESGLKAVENKKQLVDGLTALTGAIASADRPLIFCLDNLQWADSASIELLEPLLAQQKLPYVMLIGGYQTTSDNREVSETVGKLVREHQSIQLIQLENLNFDNVQTLISETIFRPKEEIKQVATLVFNKTHGNPLAVREFLLALHGSGAISFDRTHREWELDVASIQNSPPTEHVSELLASRIGHLESTISRLLQIASCIGSSFDMQTLQLVSGLSYSDTSATLTRAVREGYLLNQPSEQEGATYQFAHDRVQQAAYSLLSLPERRKIHSRIGAILLRNGSLSPEARIFDIVNQLNNSYESPDSDFIDRNKLAELNQLAGKRARQRAAFQASFKYLRTAIALYGQNIWARYDLSLQMHLEAAEVAYLCGDHEQMEALVDTALSHAKSDMDQAKVLEIKLRAKIAGHDLNEAQDIGHTALEILGLPISRQLRIWHIVPVIRILFQSWRRPRRLQGHAADASPGSARVMTDPRLLIVMRILMSLCRAGNISGNRLTPLYILKMTHLSLKHGMAPESSLAYPMFGSLLIAHLGTIDSGYRFGQMALENLSDLNKDLHCRALTLVANFIEPWKNNLRDSLEPLARANHVGVETGDAEFALIASVTGATNAFLLGHDLNSLETNLAIQSEKARTLNQNSTLGLSNIFRQAMQNLMQENQAPWLLEGDTFSENNFIQFNEPNIDESTAANLLILKMFLAVLFRRPELAMQFATEARLKLSSVTSSPALQFFVIYESLAFVGGLDKASPWQKIMLRYKLLINKRQLRKWSYHCPQNILHGYHLIEAEKAKRLGHVNRAMTHYDAAIAHARTSGFLKEHAFASELASRFYNDMGKQDLAMFFLERARVSYKRWGALTKIRWIDDEFSELIERENISQLPHAETLNLTGDHTYGNYLDLSSVIKASQVLSGEIVLENLLQRLMQVSLENAGAHSASLILNRDGTLVAEITTWTSGAGTDYRMDNRLLEETDHLPISVIQYVARTQEDLVLNDAPNEDIFTQDEYIVGQKPKSIICIPILSKSHLTGLLYLENHNSTRAFTRDRVAILKLLASQSAIAIENAKLYQQLNESRNRYLSLYENAMEGIFEVNQNGELVNVNPAAAQLLGYAAPGELLAQQRPSISSIFASADDFAVFQSELDHSGKVAGFDIQVTRKDRPPLWVSLSAQVIEDAERHHLEGSFVDITERKLREEADQARIKAEAAMDTKSQFLATMSHEIRTPMNAIVGYTDLTLGTELSEEQSDYLNTIKTSSNHLLRVVNDILDLSKVESGKLELQMAPFHLDTVFKEIENLFGLAAKNNSLTLHLPEQTHQQFIGDAVRIGQVLINLVGNAVKFTNAGSITLDVKTKPLANNIVELGFVVQDTGIGIEKSQIEVIFDSFTQGTTSTRDSGTGLGLAICQRLVDMMNGHIEVESNPGIGSTFSFTVQVREWNEEPLFQHVPPGNLGKVKVNNILLVEDNKINQDLARSVLRKAGFGVTVANNGAEAIDELRSRTYDVVLMDIRMPVMDGLEAIRIIRSDENLKRSWVIALSASVLDSEIKQAMDSGFDDYLGKPVDFADLLQRLRGPEPAGTASESEGYRINGVNFDQPLRNNEYDFDLVLQLLGDFIQIYGNADEELARHLDQQEIEEAERLLHNIAGVSGNFGADQLMAVTRDIERRIKDGDIPRAPCSEFSRELKNFISAIKSLTEKNRTVASVDTTNSG